MVTDTFAGFSLSSEHNWLQTLILISFLAFCPISCVSYTQHVTDALINTAQAKKREVSDQWVYCCKLEGEGDVWSRRPGFKEIGLFSTFWVEKVLSGNFWGEVLRGNLYSAGSFQVCTRLGSRLIPQQTWFKFYRSNNCVVLFTNICCSHEA